MRKQGVINKKILGIALFGGTFNPIHTAHLRVAEEVREYFNINKIYLMPSSLPPHKKQSNVADAKDRLEMVKLAVKDYPEFEVSDVELRRNGFSYTIDTLRYFQSTMPVNTRLYFIVGLDAFLEIHTWKSYNQLFNLAYFIVISRPQNRISKFDNLSKLLEEYIKNKISAHYVLNTSLFGYKHPELKTIFYCNVTPLHISSTQIRELIRNNRSIRFLVPDLAADYIQSRGLFL
ncbi:putative nicotinate-nucleotide adenylyltransferase [Candidatus Magnetomoraceae bacterium gMMP-15]